jgi:3-oxoacyl-[acyl-carrier protein] reductase
LSVGAAENAEAVVRDLQSKGVRAAAFKADQGDPAQVEKLIADVAAKFGRLDILVNNAGLFTDGTVDATLDTSAFDRQQAVNVTGVIAGIRTASRIMGDGGHIISMSSGVPTRVGGPGMADYASTKAAVEGRRPPDQPLQRMSALGHERTSQGPIRHVRSWAGT